MSCNRKRHPFTLIEIVICLCLLSLVGSFGAIKGWRLLSEKRFKESCRRIENALLVSKVLSQTYHIDVYLTFVKEGSSLKMVRVADVPLDRPLSSFFNRPETLSSMEMESLPLIAFYGSGFTKEIKKLEVKTSYAPHTTYQWTGERWIASCTDAKAS